MRQLAAALELNGAVEFLGAITRTDLTLPDGSKLRLATLDPPGPHLGDPMRLAYDPARVSVFRS